MVRCYSFMTYTKKGRGVITKFWWTLQMIVDGIFRGGIFWASSPTQIQKANIFLFIISFFLLFFTSFFFFFFFLTFNCYSDSLKLISYLIGSSIMETQRVRQPFMKISLGNVCSFFCHFYYRLVNTVCFNERPLKPSFEQLSVFSL